MSTTSSSETTLNIPSLLAFAVVSFLAIRYFFFSGAPASSFSSSAPPPGARNGRPIPPDKIEQVAMMFPQLARRDIEWDLVRNGGSVQATTEKVLRTGRLDTVCLGPPRRERRRAEQKLTGGGVWGLYSRRRTSARRSRRNPPPRRRRWQQEQEQEHARRRSAGVARPRRRYSIRTSSRGTTWPRTWPPRKKARVRSRR